MMPGKWNLAHFLNEDINKKAVRPEELIKLKINRSGEMI
jgi:hypothetical protein